MIVTYNELYCRVVSSCSLHTLSGLVAPLPLPARVTRSLQDEAAMKELFQNLLWPAVTGNVAWSFVSLLVTEDWSLSSVQARLAALLLLTVYLCADWLRTKGVSNVNRSYWFANGLHLGAIVVFAIAAQADRHWLAIPLAIVLLVTVVGHLTGAWEEKGSTNRPMRRALALCNALGLLVLCWVGVPTLGQGLTWTLSLAMLVVLIPWASFRFGLVKPEALFGSSS